MSSTTKPTILLVTGAWFPPQVFDILTQDLKKLGYNDVVAVSYPSTSPHGDPAQADCAGDTAHVRTEYLVPLVEAGKDVLVFAHSYGGMPASGAAAGLSKRTRSKAGKPGGVIGLIMASAFVVPEGVSCAGAMGGDTAPWVIKDNPEKDLCMPDNPHQIFAADLPSDLASQSMSIIVPQSTISFFSVQLKPVFTEPDFKGLCAYVKQLNDQAVPPPGQEAMMQGSGVDWLVRELPFSHNSGFVTGTKEMAGTIDELMHAFEAAM